jgi:multisubunit Na+/H+ antiporter MnhC subunit
VVLSFITAGYFRGETFFAQSLVITFIVVEVSLVAVALALVINAYRNTGSLDIQKLARLKG